MKWNAIAKTALFLIAAQFALFGVFDYIDGLYPQANSNSAASGAFVALYLLLALSQRVKALEDELRKAAMERHPAKGGQS